MTSVVTGLHTFRLSRACLSKAHAMASTCISRNQAAHSVLSCQRQTLCEHACVIVVLRCAQHCKCHACRACGLVLWVSPSNDLRVSQWRHWKRRSELERALCCTVKQTLNLRSCCQKWAVQDVQDTCGSIASETKLLCPEA